MNIWRHQCCQNCVFCNSHLLRSALLSCPGTLWGERALGGLWPWRGPFGGDRGIWLVPLQVAGHCWTYTDAHKHGGIKRGEQTCQNKVRTWQPWSRSINNTVDKGLWNVFLKCDITAFNGNWAEKLLLSNSCLPIKITTHFLLVFPAAAGERTANVLWWAVSFNVSLLGYHTTP